MPLIVLSIKENPNNALKFSSIDFISINEIPIRDSFKNGTSVITYN